MTSIWTGQVADAPHELWIDGDAVWDAVPGSGQARQVARIDGDHIWRVDARGRDANLLGLIRPGGEVIRSDRRTTVGYVEDGVASTLGFGSRRAVWGVTTPPSDAGAAVGMLLTTADMATPAVDHMTTTLTVAAGVAGADRDRNARRTLDRYTSRYQHAQDLQAGGDLEAAATIARSLREDVRSDRKAARSAPQLAELLVAGAWLIELMCQPSPDPGALTSVGRCLDRIDDPSLETQVLRLRVQLTTIAGRDDLALSHLDRLVALEPNNRTYVDAVEQLRFVLDERRRRARQHRDAVSALRDGLGRATSAADELSALTARAMDLEADFKSTLDSQQQLSFPRTELAERLAGAEQRQQQARALVEDVTEYRDRQANGLIRSTAEKLLAAAVAFESTTSRVVDEMRKLGP